MHSKSKPRSLSPAAESKKAETEDRYRALLKRREQSGATLLEFSKKVGIPTGTLAWWGHELRRRDRLRTATSVKVDVPTFLPVRIKPDTSEVRASASSAPYEVVLGRGRVVRVPTGFDAATLTALVRAVEAASC